jgi:hypothetical protein
LRPSWAQGDGWAHPRTLLLGAVLIAAAAAFFAPVSDPDFWWHVRVGEWIVAHGRLPGHDLFTYTVPRQRPWVDHEYLTEVLMWLVQRRFGLLGQSLVFGALTWTGFCALAAACHPRRHPYPIVALALALAVLAAGPIWGPRPQMVTFAFSCLELLWLRRYLEGRGRAILALPALTLVWGNLHGGWPIATAWCLLAAAAEAVAGHSPRARRRAITLTTLAGLSVPPVLVNPNGPAILVYPFQTLASSAQQSLISEWQSPNFHLPALWPFGLFLLLLLAGFALGRPGRLDLLLSLAGVAMALASVRNLPLCLAAATPALVASWSTVWERIGRSLPRRPLPRWAPAMVALTLVAVGGATAVRVASNLAQQAAVVRRYYPVGAADWLAAHPAVGTHMFNDYGWGGYLAYRFYPARNRRVFAFGEGHLMGDPLLRRTALVQQLGPGWQTVLHQEHVDYVISERGQPLADALAGRPGWRLVYRDRLAVIYVRSRAPKRIRSRSPSISRE